MFSRNIPWIRNKVILLLLEKVIIFLPKLIMSLSSPTLVLGQSEGCPHKRLKLDNSACSISEKNK